MSEQTTENDQPSSRNEEENGDTGDSKLELFMCKMTTKPNVYSKDPTPLDCPWTLWTSSVPKGSDKEEYINGLQQVKTVFTSCQFWESYRSMTKPSELGIGGTRISMMRHDVPPVWEDPQNRNGGCFVARIEKKGMDWIWEQLLLLAIAEELTDHFHIEDELYGLSLCEKKAVFVLSIWNKNAEREGRNTLYNFLTSRFPSATIIHYFYYAHHRNSAYDHHGSQEEKGKTKDEKE